MMATWTTWRDGTSSCLSRLCYSCCSCFSLIHALVLTFGQCIRSISGRRGLRWIHRTAFISILDAYHAPYNKSHRYWTGLALLTRCFLFLIFATNYKDNAILTNMYTVSLAIVGILTIKLCATKVYKYSYVHTLEISFLLNLELLSASLYYIKGKNGSDDVICKTITASVSFSFVTFIGIVAYHN